MASTAGAGAPPRTATAQSLPGCLRHPDAVLVLVGLLALVVGAWLYEATRPLGRAQWAPWLGQLAGRASASGWAGALPSLLHPLAFGLLSAAVLPAGPRARPLACVAWGVLNLAAEAAQHPAWQAALATGLSSWPPLARYVALGRFDPLDLAAAVAGTALALGLVQASRPGPDGETTCAGPRSPHRV